MDWQYQLISLYLFICKQYRYNLQVYCKRFSNHADLSFSDEEVITIYLFGILQKRKQIKDIYNYANQHLRDWFPKLPMTYVGFVQRLNRIAGVFVPMVKDLFVINGEHADRQGKSLLIDSMPIILAHRGRRFKAKVAPEIATSNGYCATKKLHYYGVKLHILANHQAKQLPIPAYIGITEAGMHDNKAFEQIAPYLKNDIVYGDKAYSDCFLANEKNFHLLTPVKKKKGQEFLEVADQWLSTAVASVRQPVESLFNWLEEKTGIQIASKVRSYNGLFVHVFGKLAAAMFLKSSVFSS